MRKLVLVLAFAHVQLEGENPFDLSSRVSLCVEQWLWSHILKESCKGVQPTLADEGTVVHNRILQRHILACFFFRVSRDHA